MISKFTKENRGIWFNVERKVDILAMMGNRESIPQNFPAANWAGQRVAPGRWRQLLGKGVLGKPMRRETFHRFYLLELVEIMRKKFDTR